MNGTEYMAVLLERQAEVWDGTGFPPLLEWFVRPGDEELFTPPVRAPEPRRVRPRRKYRPASELREMRDRLVLARDTAARPMVTDRAATHGQALGPVRTQRLSAGQDRRLQDYASLTRRIEALDHKILAAEAREEQCVL